MISRLLKLFYCIGFGLILSKGFGKEYGKFNLNVTEAVLCKGPKVKNCTTIDLQLERNRVMKFHVETHEPVILTNSKIAVLNHRIPFLRLHMDNPCSHLFLKPIFQKFLNISEKCTIPVGTFEYNIDIVEIAEKYFAKEFVFGDFTFKSTFFSSTCNFACCNLDVSISPKRKE